MIFGQLLTSSNYDDDEKKVTGGRNGYGAKLCNIFSTEFTIETACKESGRMFKQVSSLFSNFKKLYNYICLYIKIVCCKYNIIYNVFRTLGTIKYDGQAIQV